MPISSSMLHFNNDRAQHHETCTKDSHKHEYYIERAAALAQKSDMYSHRHGCVIVDKRGKIISEGFNYHFREMSIHAEIDALSKIKNKKMSEYVMYVVRIGTDKMQNPLKYSRPCENCSAAILKYGVGKVYYSTSYDFIVCSSMIKLSTPCSSGPCTSRSTSSSSSSSGSSNGHSRHHPSQSRHSIHCCV